MPKIVVTNEQGFTAAQKQKLESLGEVTYYDSTPVDGQEYLQRVQGADIICSGSAGLKDAYAELRDVYVTVPFVSVAFVDLSVLGRNGVTLSNAPGANAHAVAEWVLAMAILLMRNLYSAINREETYRVDGALPPTSAGLSGRSMVILGKGHVGTRVGKLAEAFGMHVSFVTRSSDVRQAVKAADIAVDALSSNPSTQKLLDEAFFAAMRPGSYFITITRAEIIDEDALLRALDSGHIAGAASDCGGILVGDTTDPLYQKMRQHPKILATPHLAYNSEIGIKTGNDIMISNIAAWIAGKPQNVLQA